MSETFQLNAKYEFKDKVKKIKFFNPRLSKVYIKPVSSIDDETKNEVENDVIGYREKEIDPHLKLLFEKFKDKQKRANDLKLALFFCYFISFEIYYFPEAS